MPSVVPLNPPQPGLDRILNVSQKVGPDADCPNQPDDVEAVQRLIGIAASEFAGKHGFGVPQPTGKFDPLTGFYIYHMQTTHNRHHPGATIDGCITPARGVSYGGGVFTIVHFNNIAKSKNKAAWEALIRKYCTT